MIGAAFCIIVYIIFYKSEHIKLLAYSHHHKDVVKAQPLAKNKDKFSPQIIPLIIQAHDKKENSDHQQKHTYFVNKNQILNVILIRYSSNLHCIILYIVYITSYYRPRRKLKQAISGLRFQDEDIDIDPPNPYLHFFHFFSFFFAVSWSHTRTHAHTHAHKRASKVLQCSSNCDFVEN